MRGIWSAGRDDVDVRAREKGQERQGDLERTLTPDVADIGKRLTGLATAGDAGAG